jgi:DNA-binding HxlR family transcriptional regulator
VTGTQLLWRRWAPEILLALSDGPKRFNRLLAVPGIYDKILTERLRDLEVGGLVSRSVETIRPIRVAYALTDAGRRDLPGLQAIQEVARIAS